MSILLENNYFKNWHRPAFHGRAKKKKLSALYPTSVHHHHNGADISFQDEFGEQITIFLTKEALSRFKNQINSNNHE